MAVLNLIKNTAGQKSNCYKLNLSKIVTVKFLEENRDEVENHRSDSPFLFKNFSVKSVAESHF